MNMSPRKRKERTYEVEVILEVRGSERKAIPEYLVQWWGYSDKSNSWEPESLFKDGTERLLDSVRRQIHKQYNLTRQDFVYEDQSVILAKSWIEQEQELFCTTYSKDQEKRKKRRRLTIPYMPKELLHARLEEQQRRTEQELIRANSWREPSPYAPTEYDTDTDSSRTPSPPPCPFIEANSGTNGLARTHEADVQNLSCYELPEDTSDTHSSFSVDICVPPLQDRATMSPEPATYPETTGWRSSRTSNPVWMKSVLAIEKDISENPLPGKVLLPLGHKFFRNIRLLGWPLWLHDALRTCSSRGVSIQYIVHANSPLHQHQTHYESLLLSSVLTVYTPAVQMATGPTPWKQASVIFVHLSSLLSFMQPGLPLRNLRLSTAHTFIGYGKVPVETDGPSKVILVNMCSLFTAGGLLTLTPQVILNDPFRLYDVLEAIHRRAVTWKIYAPAYVLGSAFFQCYGSLEQAQLALQSQRFVFKFILDAVIDLKLELTSGILTRCPPIHSYDLDSLLTACITDYGHFVQFRSIAVGNMEVEEDLRAQQRNIVTSSAYRRFIVLKLDSMPVLADEFEWISCTEFLAGFTV